MWNPTNNKELHIQSSRGPWILCMAACLTLVMVAYPAQGQDSAAESLRMMGKTFASVAKRVSPAVVFVKVEKVVESQPNVQFFSPSGGDNPFGDDFLQRFFGTPSPQEQPRQFRQIPRQQQRVMGQGSGFIISPDGYIMTNNHVVGDADKVTVKLEDGREFTAKTIGTDPHSDVAVIKIDAKNLPVLALGNSDTLEVGDWVLAVGNPFGLSHTLTAGIVSAKGRSSLGLADYENFIQTDAAINPGNSGGPLVDLNGTAIGMNTAIFSQSGGYMGIGFAIPINMARAIKDQLIKTGSVIRGYLGIVIQDLTPELAKSFGLDDHKGILVAEVTEDSPAEKAGLRQGDVIIELGGKAVEEVGTFRNQVSLKAPGTKEKITVLRDGKRQTLTITIGKLPDSGLTASTESHTPDKLGLTVQTLTPDLAERFGYQGEEGVVVTQVNPGSVAELAGIQPGMLIQEVDRQQIHNVNEFKQAIKESGNKKSVLLLIRDDKYSRYVVLKIED
ncbi:MAG: DegQ family serine endoprotease [Methanosarcinaceae archaeon]|nr:DegQ family serine endoprotease [Methanosarcinaceae archaeon]